MFATHTQRRSSRWDSGCGDVTSSNLSRVYASLYSLEFSRPECRISIRSDCLLSDGCLPSFIFHKQRLFSYSLFAIQIFNLEIPFTKYILPFVIRFQVWVALHTAKRTIETTGALDVWRRCLPRTAFIRPARAISEREVDVWPLAVGSRRR